MENIPLISTTLNITGDGFNADELTCVVEVQPTKIWHQSHERVKVTHPNIATTAWVYRLDKQNNWSLGEAIGDVLDVFWAKRNELNEFVSRNGLRIEIRCNPSGDASLIEYIIQPEIINKLALLGASLSLAVYKNALLKSAYENENPLPAEE